MCVWNLSGLATHQSLNWCAKQIYRQLNISLLDVEIAQPPKHDAKLWISIRKGRSCMQGVTCMVENMQNMINGIQTHGRGIPNPNEGKN